MREKIHEQPPLVATAIAHVHAQELQQISEVLDQLEAAAAWVHADLIGPGRKIGKGRKRPDGR
jgi:hypothetical protein